MKRMVVVVAWIILLAVSASAEEEPNGYAGLFWGSPPAKLREALKGRCSTIASDEDGNDVCEAYALGDLNGRLTLVQIPGRGLAAWQFDCPQADAARLSALITTRFGPPPHDGPYQGFWEWAASTVSLRKQECSVIVSTKDGQRRIDQIEQDRAVRARRASDVEEPIPAGGGASSKRASGRGGG